MKGAAVNSELNDHGYPDASAATSTMPSISMSKLRGATTTD